MTKYAVIDHHSMWGWPKQETTPEEAQIIFVWNDFTIEDDVRRWQSEGKKVICFEHGWNAFFDYELNNRKWLSDLYLALGNSSAKSLQRYGIPKERILIAGNPRLDILFKKFPKTKKTKIPKILYTALHWTGDMDRYNDKKLKNILSTLSPYAEISVKTNKKSKINIPANVNVWNSDIDENRNLFEEIVKGLQKYDIILTPKESTFDFIALKLGKSVFRIGEPSEYRIDEDPKTRTILPKNYITTELLSQNTNIGIDLGKELVPSIKFEDILKYINKMPTREYKVPYTVQKFSPPEGGIKEWKYYSPSFEFTKNLPVDSSAWSGHYFFAYDLVSNIKPKVIVELGTHKGNSLFSFAQAIKDNKLDTELHGIDTWEGEKHAGYYDQSVYENFLDISKKYYKDVEIIPHKILFDDAVKEFKDNSIDILHIDGLHTYEAVKHDFETWLPKVNENTGIILFHDVVEKKEDFGVYKLWEELQKKYKTVTFTHYHGLGVVFLNKNTPFSEDIVSILPEYYSSKSLNQDYAKQISDKNLHITNITALNETQKKLMEQLEKKTEQLEKETEQIKQEMKQLKQRKIWKMMTILSKLFRHTKNFFINIVNDGPTETFKRINVRIRRFIANREQLMIEKDPYRYWIRNHRITFKKRNNIKEDLSNLKYKPLISIVMPVYNVDIKWIRQAIKSIKGQIYTNWELCIADDASTNENLKKYLKLISLDKKIKVVFREKNGHISEASNTALELAEGEFIALMDNDDIIHPHALAEVVKVLNKKRDTDFIYSDEDKLNMKGERVEPFFKPDWSPDLFMSTNYMSHLSVIRKDLIDKVGGFRKGYEGSQDYDLFLRITEITNKIEHIPDVLYSWRKIPGSTAAVYTDKGYASSTTIKALNDALERRKIIGEVMEGLFPGSFRVKYEIIGKPLVSILIPTLNKYEYIVRCISSILEKTTYSNFEIIVIDTGSTDENVLNYYENIKQDKRIKIINWNKKFNYSSVNNFGVKNSKGEYIILLNNDTEIISPDWIEGMLEHAQRKEIGAVGVELLYPDNRVQHAGVILGINGGTGKGVAGHAFRFAPRDIQGFPVQKDIIKNYSAVTAACLMISRKKFNDVQGLEEKFRIAFNDVDFCLKLLSKGYYNIYTPYVRLYHHESISVGTPEAQTRDVKEFKKEIGLMYKRWGNILLKDRFFNKNYSLRSEQFQIKTK